MALEATSKHLRSASELLLVIPIKTGFVEKSNLTMSYATRLRNLLEVLSSTFPFSTEKTLVPAASVLEMLQNIYAVQYAVIDRFDRPELVVAVNFDSSWEAYFQNLVDNVGRLLDLVFSHCEGFDGNACSDGYERFTTWIRRYQVQCGLFYTATHDLTVDDLRGLRSKQPAGARILTVAQANSSAVNAINATGGPEKTDYEAARKRGLRRLLVALLGMRDDFAVGVERWDNKTRDARNRYDAAMLELLKGIDLKNEELPSFGLPDEMRLLLGKLLAFPKPGVAQPTTVEEADVGYANMQGNVITAYKKVNHACLVLVQCSDRRELGVVLRTLKEKGWPTSDHEMRKQEEKHDLRVNVGLTYQALERSGLNQQALRSFPKEFREGMRARAGLLGDIGPNHPDNWDELEINWPWNQVPSGQRVPVACVDVVITVQKAALSADYQDDERWNPAHPLHGFVSELADGFRRVAGERSPPRILRVEPLRRRAGDHFKLSTAERTESQPLPMIGPAKEGPELPANGCALGELILGYPDRRGKVLSAADANGTFEQKELFRDGTFLVLRKLRQDVPEFERYVGSTAAALGLEPDYVRGLIVGEDPEGRSLAVAEQPAKSPGNKFDYRASTAARCPAHAHVRRTNPRLGANRADPNYSWEPRILRRSISYGSESTLDRPDDGTERGMMFFAYNASIAQQFEVIQRWVAGGNSTALSSSLSDLMLGVHRSPPATYSVQSASGTQYFPGPTRPFVTLRWGMYLYVPPLAAIELLLAAADSKKQELDPRRVADGELVINALDRIGSGELGRDAWKQVIEEDAHREDSMALWSKLRDAGGRKQTPYGTLIADYKAAREVLANAKYSVVVYEERMKKCIDEVHYLGLDAGAEYRKLARPANDFLRALPPGGSSGAAFRSAIAIAREVIERTPSGQIVDIKRLARLVVLQLADAWVGLPLKASERELRNKIKESGRSYDAVSEDEKARLRGALELSALVDREDLRELPGVAEFKTLPAEEKTKLIAKLDTLEQLEFLESFMYISRYCFLPYPSTTLEEQAIEGGRALRAAYAEQLPTSRMAEHLRAAYKNDTDIITALLGAIVGFAAPAVANIVSVLARLSESGELERLARAGVVDDDNVFELVERSMIESPQPPVLYRTEQVGGERKMSVIGLHSACMSAPAGSDPLQWVFGGNRGGDLPTQHGCPARSQGMATIAGVVRAVLSYQNLTVEGILEFLPNQQEPAARPIAVAKVPVVNGPRASACPMSRTDCSAGQQAPTDL